MSRICSYWGWFSLGELAGQAALDRGVLLAADIGRNARIERIVGRAVEFHIDQRLALGEQQHRHRLRIAWRSTGNHRAVGTDINRLPRTVDLARVIGLGVV